MAVVKSDARHGPGLVRVSGPSMEPTLHHGDVVLVWWGGRAAPGRLVLFRHPAQGDVLAVKRVAYPDPDDRLRWWVERDNPREGVTSFDVGSIADEDALAVVLARIAPRPGRLRQRHTP